jgi:hypothetical protein
LGCLSAVCAVSLPSAFKAALMRSVAATTALALSEYRKIEPVPVEEFLFFDHPSGKTRIRMAMDWKAAHLAEVEAKAK